jgi:hypothetical protein
VPDPHGAAEPVEQPGRFREWQLAETAVEQLSVKELKRLARLLDAGQWVLLTLGEVLEELTNRVEAKLARVAFAVEQNVAANPVGVALTGFRATEAGAGELAELIEQSWWLRSR